MRISTFQAQRPAVLFGRRFRAGEEVHLVYALDHPSEEKWIEAHAGNGGPWGWGGFTSRDIRRAYRLATDVDFIQEK